MSCERCTSVPRLKFKGNKTYIFSQVRELIEKIEKILKQKGYSVSNFDNGIEVKSNSFEEILVLLKNYDELIEMEYSDIQVLPLERESLTPSCLCNVKSLNLWINILDSKELIEILQENSLKTYFQPIVTAKTREIYGHEALIRGVKKNGEIISPFELFKKAKDSNLLFNLDRQSRETNIINSYKNNLDSKIFINFTPTAIYDPEFCLRTTMTKIKEYNIKPERIVFEVIETEGVSKLSHLKRILDYYRSEGFNVALDDLGSGYASLNRLFNLKPDYVKIDMDIIRNIHKDDVKQSIFKAIVDIGKNSNIKTIAEGVETKEELDFVVSEGADLIQGYYYSRPVEKPFEFAL